jgi:hypothetical protein
MKAAPVVSKAAAPVLREGVQAAGRVAREIGEQAPEVKRAVWEGMENMGPYSTKTGIAGQLLDPMGQADQFFDWVRKRGIRWESLKSMAPEVRTKLWEAWQKSSKTPGHAYTGQFGDLKQYEWAKAPDTQQYANRAQALEHPYGLTESWEDNLRSGLDALGITELPRTTQDLWNAVQNAQVQGRISKAKGTELLKTMRESLGALQHNTRTTSLLYPTKAEKTRKATASNIKLWDDGNAWLAYAPDGRKVQVGKGVVGSAQDARKYAAEFFSRNVREEAGAYDQTGALKLPGGGVPSLASLVGENPKVDTWARRWNEERFIQLPTKPTNISEPILTEPTIHKFWTPDGTVEAKYQFAIADDASSKKRKLLMARNVDTNDVPFDNELGKWQQVGEYDGENLGIMEAYRGKGAGTAFVEQLIAKGKLKPSIGYSPEGLRTVEKARANLLAKGGTQQLGGAVPGGVTAAVPQQPGESDEDYQRRVQLGMGLMAGGVALGGVRNVGKAGRPTSTNPATQKLFDMYYGPKLKGADATVRQRVKDFATKATQWFTDRNVSVSELVHMAERAAGVKEGGLPVEMQADLLMRLNPNKAAAVHLQEGLQPAIQSVGDDLPYLDAYLTHQNNIDVARSIGQKVERSVMSERIKPSLAARNLNAERGTLRLKEYRAKVLEAGDQKKLVRYDELNDQYGKAQDDLTRLDEQLYEKAQELDMLKAPSEMVRPPKNLFVGWTEGQIQEFAEREGRNVFQPDWWDKLDPIAIKDARSSLSRGGGKTKQIGQLKAELSRIKAERAKMLADSKSLEGQMESVLNGIDTEAGNRLKAEIAERQKRITELEKRVYDDTERALGRQRREAMTKGADAEANRMFSGGLRVADSEQALANLPNELGSERYAKVEQAANQVYALVDQLRARLVKSGVWSQELADTLKQQYPHYVQTYILEKHADSPMGVGGKGIGLSDRQLRQLTIKGTEKDREAPLGSMVRMVFQTEQMARKNDVFNAFVRLRDTLAQSDPAWSSRIRQIEDPSDIVKSGPNAEHVIQGYQNGNKVMYAVPKELGLAYEAKDGVIPILNKLMTLFKMGATSRNPLFLSGNAVMDAMTFISRESVRAGGSQHLPKIVKALAEGYIDAFKGLPSGTYKGDTANLLKGGGGIFGYFQSKPEMTAKMVQYLRQRNALDIRGKDDLLHLLKQLATGEPVEAIGERVELAPRVASYKLAKKAGKADQLAVDAARSVTMDFARGGTASKLLDQFIPFFNVGMQSPAQVVRAWKENPKGFIATAVELLAGPTVAVEAWNRSDPQRAKDYEDVPQYVKDQGIVIMLPVEAPIDKQGNRRPQFVFLRTREYTPFVSLTREAVNRVMGGNPRDWDDLIGRGVLSSTSPVSGSSGSEIASGIQMPVAGTFTQLMTNRDLYRDKHIASQYADEQASAFSKTLAEWTNTRPSQVEFAIRDIGSGVAGMGLAASDAFTGNLRGGNTPQDIPGIGGVAGRFIRGSTGQRLEEAQQATMSQDVQDILRREGITYNIGQVQRTINGVPLTMDEQTSYQQLVNELVEKNIMATVKTPVWATLTAEQKERQIQRMVALAKDQARAQIMEGKAATPTGRGSSASPLPAGVQRWTGPQRPSH